MKKESVNVTKYEFDNDIYYISNNIFEIKITNFFGACIPKLYTSDMKIPFIDMEEKNNYFDLHYFLNNLLDTIEIVNKEDIEFLDEIIPKKYRNKDNKLYMKKYVDLFKPSTLLKNNYFKDFTKKQDMVELMSTTDYYTGNSQSRRIEDSQSRRIKDLSDSQSRRIEDSSD